MNQYHPEDAQSDAARWQEALDHIDALRTQVTALKASLSSILDSFDCCPPEVDWQFWVEAHEAIDRQAKA